MQLGSVFANKTDYDSFQYKIQSGLNFSHQGHLQWNIQSKLGRAKVSINISTEADCKRRPHSKDLARALWPETILGNTDISMKSNTRTLHTSKVFREFKLQYWNSVPHRFEKSKQKRWPHFTARNVNLWKAFNADKYKFY